MTKPLPEPAFVVGIDVGGTFTDFVLFKPAPDGGTFTHHKEPSSPDDPARAVGEGLIAVMALAGVARDAEGVILSRAGGEGSRDARLRSFAPLRTKTRS